MKNQNLYKLTNSQMLKINGGCQKHMFKFIERCFDGKTYTVMIVDNSEGDYYDFHWHCSCGYSQSEGSLADAKIFASLHLQQTHGNIT